ncbi:LINE-1 retrotransposable element ORF2 protein [Bienertia sinuspersici]
MLKVVQMQKAVKQSLRQLNKQYYSHIEDRFHKAKEHLLELKRAILQAPTDSQLLQREVDAISHFKEMKEAYESFLFQRAKVTWLKEGDANTKFFHRSIKRRRFRQRILEIKDKDGNVKGDPTSMNKAFEEFYIDLLGTAHGKRMKIKQEIVNLGTCLNEEQASSLIREFTNEEIKRALFSIPGSKAPCPDGFNSTFYKESCQVIREDICNAVKDFFQHGKMLKQINCTKLALIPKIQNPTTVSKFRPIACCNTLYKLITKLICSRLKPIHPHLIADNQAGFIQGRQIFHNISIVQDLVGVYNRKATPPCCMLKVDI